MIARRFSPLARIVVRALAVVSLLLGSLEAARAQTVSPKITGVRIGFDGYFKLGYWTPLEVTIKGGAEALIGRLEVTVPDGDGVPTVISTGDVPPVRIGAGEEKSVRLFVKIGQESFQMPVVFRVGDDVAARRVFDSDEESSLQRVLEPVDELILVIGKPVSILKSRAEGDDGNSLDRVTKVALINSVDKLPTEWYGYDSVDGIVITTSDEKFFRPLQLNPRAKALVQWVERGGRIVISAGREANAIFADGAPLAPFSPGTLAGTVPLRQTSPIETYVEAKEGVIDEDEARDFRIDVPHFTGVRGRIEAHAGRQKSELPLVVRTSFGFGEVVCVMLDLDQSPWRSWGSREALFGKLLARTEVKEDEQDGNLGMRQLTTLGYNDLAGQLRSALDQFTGVQPVAFWIVGLLIVIYLLCIGPFDYWFVKRVLKRVELTWITFPLIVVLFSAGAYVMAYQLKGDQLCLNQVDVVDVDVERERVRGTTWANLFSPRIESYNLTLSPQIAGVAAGDQPEVLLSWMGMPGKSFGAMSGPGGGLLGSAYRFAPELNALKGVPIAVWSSKAFTARWSIDATPQLTSDLQAAADDSLSGSITAGDDLELEDCALLYDRWAYRLGKLTKGKSVAFDRQLQPQTAATYLQRAIEGAGNAGAAPYERDSLDINRIVETMMCHDAAGGSSHTRLANQYQRFIDLTSQLQTGKAILIGRKQGRSTLLQRDGVTIDGPQDRYFTFYRFLLPVAEKKP